ncbi:glycoside hydrolase family 2 protein [Paenibacillus brevis]|uniref:Beta galactosidase jelly roll domain-containing protein n=1 Tax=Paenibacillus brevis TaxID=2841508 RepID=A0ABS6FUA5_9BACL|nr:sugar-binding domain-containing protein [Paenibacillus brevis]MBU5673795.1 beta galactosidase jelly roll domain-containing protein [Paenibacillus brevis]
MTTKKYIKDYPRPQFVREDWNLLNGEWRFDFDDDNVGEAAGWHRSFAGNRTINVPFTYETKASGIGEEAHHPYVWYNRQLDIPSAAQGKRILLHFQAVDYIAQVWVNGEYVGRHRGGYAAFSFDITPYVSCESPNELTVKVEDSKDATQTRGKQRWVDDNFECFYVQTTGIWQSVWLEYVDEQHIDAVKITPDLDASTVHFDYQVKGGTSEESGLTLETVITMKGRQVKRTSLAVDRPWLTLEVDLVHERNGPWKKCYWSPGNPNLYDVEFILYRNGVEIDHVYSYFGMRKISIQQGRVLLNNIPIYQRLLLDQGYWPESHLTPPSEEALIEDIELLLKMGYNGVRKHMKLEDPRFLYWCDVKGVLVWSEMAATYEFNDQAVQHFTEEWMEIVRQQYNHPSIITWVPFNESWGIMNVFKDVRQQKFTEAIYQLTKAFDPNRPVITNDGWEHTVSDILTLHDYVETKEQFLERYASKDDIVNNVKSFNRWKYAFADGYSYKGQPIILSEFGGIAFKSDKGWGYGGQVVSEEAFFDRFRGIHEAVKATDYIVGYCYTQITDVQQEVNGLLTEEREPKLPLEKIKEINLL